MDQVGAFVERVVQDGDGHGGLRARLPGEAEAELRRRQAEVRVQVGHQHGLWQSKNSLLAGVKFNILRLERQPTESFNFITTETPTQVFPKLKHTAYYGNSEVN